jgi:hypothetical protein
VVQLELFQLPMGGGGSPLLAACSRELDGSCCASAPSFLNLTKQAPILPTSGPPLLPASDREMSLGEILLPATDWGMSFGLLLQPFFHELNTCTYVARVQVNRRRRHERQRATRERSAPKKN